MVHKRTCESCFSLLVFESLVLPLQISAKIADSNSQMPPSDDEFIQALHTLRLSNLQPGGAKVLGANGWTVCDAHPKKLLAKNDLKSSVTDNAAGWIEYGSARSGCDTAEERLLVNAKIFKYKRSSHRQFIRIHSSS